MGLFSKKTKPNPVIDSQGLHIEYVLKDEYWTFRHAGVCFVSYGPRFSAPSLEVLTSILADLEKLAPEMARRLANGWKEWKNVKTNDGESYEVNLTRLNSENTFEVSWSGGASWGDMGIEFAIRNHQIADEAWGD